MKESYKLAILIIIMSFSHLTTQAQFITFNHDGIDRQYLYYEPVSLNANMPLVFAMHGYTGDANSMRNYTQMNQIADQYGFAICYPRGTLDSQGNRFWNVGYAFHQTETVDDVDFLIELAQYLQVTHNLNSDYTFATGFSNGGEMCYLLACQAYNTFKAVAPVAGMIMQDILNQCDQSQPIPLFEIHGSQDNVTPLSGDPTNNDGWGSYPSIDTTINYFAVKNGCTSNTTQTLPDINTTDGSFVMSEKYLNGTNNNEVWYYEVVGGGHEWPGDSGNMDIDAGEEAWLFFQHHINNTLSLPNFENLEEAIRIFPNPTKNIITIHNPGELRLKEINIYNTLGVNLNIEESHGQMDITNLNQGIYLLSIKTLKGTIIKKVVKN